MRKFLLLILLIFVIVFNSVTVYANSYDTEGISISPYYTSLYDTKLSFEVSSGVAIGKITVKAFENENIDKVIGDIRIVNHRTGNVVKTWSGVRLSNTYGNVYSVIKRYAISNKGTYHIAVTVKVYSGSKLKESVYLKSLPATY